MKKLFLIYSNFSRNCKNVLQTANQLDNDINKLCIDNKKIRNIVSKEKKFNITVVPTILLQDNNTFEKYEGEIATNFLNKILENKKKVSAKQKNEELKKYNLLKSKNQQLLEQAEIIKSLQKQITNEETKTIQPQNDVKIPAEQNNVEMPKRTNIMDLEEEEEEEEEEDIKLLQKPSDLNSKVEQFKKEREQNLK